MGSRSFRHFVEQELGTLPRFFIYALLEWIMIALLFLDGFLTFLCNQFAKLFELRVPCLLCTRIDHILLHKNCDSYYNESICEDHKKNISALAYCHVHRKLSDIKGMCEGCLLSFATGKDADPDTQKSLHGFVNKERDRALENDLMVQLRPKGRDDDSCNADKNGVERCSCCGDPLKKKHSSKAVTRNSSINARLLSQLPVASPRGVGASWRFEDTRHLELPHVRYSELKFMENESEIHEDEPGHNAAGREGHKGDINEEPQTPRTPRTPRTPGLMRGNRFFGIPLTDSAAASPRMASRFHPKKMQSEKPDSFADANDVNESEGESLLNRLKKQVRLDQKSLIELYMELDEERSASAVAANNAMAMITRLQAEKASVQMEALQYQRMMEEQAEYDQEALQVMKDLLDKREEEMKGLESDLDTYRLRYGPRDRVGSEDYEVDGDDNYQEYECRSVSSMSDGGRDHGGQ